MATQSTLSTMGKKLLKKKLLKKELRETLKQLAEAEEASGVLNGPLPLRERLRDPRPAELSELEKLGRKAEKERAKRLLEKSFIRLPSDNRYPSKGEKLRIVSLTNLSIKQVDGWFQRRRQVQNAEDVEDSWYDDAVA